jgi:uncharacterized membrane protein
LNQAAAVVIAFGFIVVFVGFTMGVVDGVIPSPSSRERDPLPQTGSIDGGTVGLILLGTVVIVTGATMTGDLES